MDTDPDRAVLVVLVVAVGVLWIAGWSPQLVPQPVPVDEGPPGTVSLGDDGPRVWPYTASSPSFRAGVSPINVVFDADPETVRDLFAEEPDWEATRSLGDDGDAVPAEDPGLFGWRVRGGDDRYVFVTGDRGRPDVRDDWREPTYHLYRGQYFGTQDHLRVYDGSVGGESWTLVQAHSEHWDWFSLTHRVDSVERPRERLERELLATDRVERIDRNYYGNGGSFDADGWATVVTLSGAVLVVPAARRRWSGLQDAVGSRPILGEPRQRPVRALLDRPPVRGVGLAAGLAAVVLGVRGAGLLAEAVGLPFGAVSKALYAAMAVGVPAVALLGGRGLDHTTAFRMGAGGVALGLIVDYALLSVTVLPLVLVVHRTIAVVATGVLATAFSATGGDGEGEHAGVRGNGRLAVGAALWVLVLVVPHVGL